MTTRRVLRWSPESVTDDEAQVIADAARRHFRQRELEAARRNVPPSTGQREPSQVP